MQPYDALGALRETVRLPYLLFNSGFGHSPSLPTSEYPLKKIQENNMSEIMGVVLDEAREAYMEGDCGRATERNGAGYGEQRRKNNPVDRGLAERPCGCRRIAPTMTWAQEIPSKVFYLRAGIHWALSNDRGLYSLHS
jgi:hypothetical protein